MRKVTFVLACVLAIAPLAAFAQDDAQATGSNQSTSSSASTSQSKESKGDASAQAQSGPRFLRTLTNVQIELTLTDQIGTQPAEKKTVSMIVASGSWGKIRNTAARTGPFTVGLNVDARPLVSSEGPIQLELTIYYYPPQGKADATVLPTELNQSLTIVLQSGKPMLISQSADPASDRKVAVEVKATVLK